MHAQVINDQKLLAGCPLDQPAEEADEKVSVQRAGLPSVRAIAA
jgi:hypothetical protein